MFIFVKLQNCVKWLTDSCFSVQNTQRFGQFYSDVHKYQEWQKKNRKRNRKIPRIFPPAQLQ